MKKIIFSLLSTSFILIFGLSSPVLAEKIPVRITPIQVISTQHDAIEVGDFVEFAIVEDVYKKDRLYLVAGTRIAGVVDFASPNGWVNESAELRFKKFRTRDVNQRLVLIEYPLNIDGNILRVRNARELFRRYFGRWFRGPEIFIEPDERVFNLFIDSF